MEKETKPPQVHVVNSYTRRICATRNKQHAPSCSTHNKQPNCMQAPSYTYRALRKAFLKMSWNVAAAFTARFFRARGVRHWFLSEKGIFRKLCSRDSVPFFVPRSRSRKTTTTSHSYDGEREIEVRAKIDNGSGRSRVGGGRFTYVTIWGPPLKKAVVSVASVNSGLLFSHMWRQTKRSRATSRHNGKLVIHAFCFLHAVYDGGTELIRVTSPCCGWRDEWMDR